MAGSWQHRLMDTRHEAESISTRAHASSPIAAVPPTDPFELAALSGQVRCAASAPELTLISMSLVSRSSSPPITVVMAATTIGYHSPL
jgi:hypothetical protein